MSFLDNLIEEYYKESAQNPDVAKENFNFAVSNNRSLITEAEYDKKIRHLRVAILDPDKFVKVNDCKEITNPVFFSKNGAPTDDGFLSNQIFGITREDRAGTYGYIDLNDWYLDPSCYKDWCRIDKRVKDIISKNGTYSLDDKGYIIEDPDGKNGIKFLRDNIENIRFKRTESHQRDMRVDYLEYNKKNMFIRKYIVIPPFYRDVNNSRNGSVGVDGINKLYQRLLLAVQSLKQTQEYGFDMSGPMQLKVQEILQAIYDWACGNTNSTIQVEQGMGIGKKFGVLRRAVMNKTSNYSARLVITQAELKTHRPEDLIADIDHAAIPLYACIACLRPFIVFWMKRFFENEFIGTELYPVLDESGQVKYITPKEPLIQFSEDKIVDEMEKFIHAYNDRFVPITVVDANSGKTYYMRYKGSNLESNQNDIKPIVPNSSDPYNRRLTWCDLFYMAAIDESKDKNVLITRFPVDRKENVVATGINISSTIDTVQVYMNHNFYKYYPKITDKEINTDTDAKFVDTLKISNTFLPGLNGDYDGDTVSIKIPFTIESNKELDDLRKSKRNYLDMSGKNIKKSEHDCVQSLYMITKVLEKDKDKITKPNF